MHIIISYIIIICIIPMIITLIIVIIIVTISIIRICQLANLRCEQHSFLRVWHPQNSNFQVKHTSIIIVMKFLLDLM